MGRAPCCDKNGLKKGPWTPEEDQKLIHYIQKHGYGNWRTLPKNAGLQRCGKSCRLRWTNYLRPDIKRGRFSFDEEETIIQLHSILGNKWSAIASRLPGRTDNEIKNYWNTHIRKRLLRMGIDPVTHSPRLDLLDLSSILSSSSLYATSSPSQMSTNILLNPELLKLASSLISSQRRDHHHHHHQNLINFGTSDHNNQIPQHGFLQTQDPPLVQELPLTMADHEPNVDAYHSSEFTHFGHWQGDDNGMASTASTSLTQDYVPSILPPSYHYYNTSDQHLMVDPHSSFGLASVLSTPSNSNSTFINGGSSTEDERESYNSSNMLKFEIPDILDVNNFICN